MGIITTKQYNRLQEAKKAGNMELHAQILAEGYGEDSTIIDVEIEEIEFDYELAANEKAAGLTNGEIAKKYGVTVQKVNAVLKAGA